MDATVDDRTVLRHLRTLSTSSRSTSSCPQSASLLRSGRPYQHGMSPRRRRVYGSPGWMRIRNTVPVNHIVWMRVSPVGVDHSAATGSQSVELTESFSTTSIVLNEHYEEACRSSLHQPLLLYLGKPREWKGNAMWRMIPWVIFFGGMSTALVSSMHPSHDCRQWMIGCKPFVCWGA
jgi:hypothetical protein